MADLAAVLWDMDGTLVDSESLWSITMAELAAHLGGELSAETREELYYDKAKLLANGDRWERELAKSIELDAPYR